MKKILAGLVCCMLLCTSLLTTPASAAARVISNEDLIKMGTPLKLNGNTFFKRNGSAPVFTDPQCKYALDLMLDSNGDRVLVYYDRQGNIYDVDDILKEKYYAVFPFYEGLAAVIKLNNGAPTQPVDMRFTLGYVNTEGEEVIPCQYNVISDCHAQGFYTSRFKDGYAYVFRGEEGYIYSSRPVTGSVAKIDRNGNIVSDWVHYNELMSVNIWGNRENEPVFKDLQLTDSTRDYSTEQVRIDNVFTDYGNQGETIPVNVSVDCDAVVMPVVEWTPYHWTGSIISAKDLGLDASAAKPEQALSFRIDMCTPPGWVDTGNEFVFDDGGIAYGATATNHGSTSISARYALVSYDPLLHPSYDREAMSWTGAPYFLGQVHFFEIALAPGESEQYIFSSAFNALSGGDYRFIWVNFDSKQEMEDFKRGVPFEKGADEYQAEPRQLDLKLGAQWLKDTFHITPLAAK